MCFQFLIEQVTQNLNHNKKLMPIFYTHIVIHLYSWGKNMKTPTWAQQNSTPWAYNKYSQLIRCVLSVAAFALILHRTKPWELFDVSGVIQELYGICLGWGGALAASFVRNRNSFGQAARCTTRMTSNEKKPWERDLTYCEPFNFTSYLKSLHDPCSLWLPWWMCPLLWTGFHPWFCCISWCPWCPHCSANTPWAVPHHTLPCSRLAVFQSWLLLHPQQQTRAQSQPVL